MNFPKVILSYRHNPKEFKGKYWQPNYLKECDPGVEEYKKEWRLHLVKKNMEQIYQSLPIDKVSLRFSFYSMKLVEVVFNCCRILKQPPEVRYLAVDILDKFLINHFHTVNDSVKKSKHTSKLEWKYILVRMTNQSFLRIMTSIQIASKYCSHTTTISTEEILDTLSAISPGYYCSKREIVKSEMRILKTLKYNIPSVTPLTYIEMFFEDFTNERWERYLQMSSTSFFNLCIDVLDVTVVFHREIYKNLLNRYRRKCLNRKMSKDMLYIEADYMYLAASVILTSAILQDPTNFAPCKVLEFFSSVTNYESQEIEALGILILQTILKK